MGPYEILQMVGKVDVSCFHGTFNVFFRKIGVCLEPFCSSFNMFLSLFCKKVSKPKMQKATEI